MQTRSYEKQTQRGIELDVISYETYILFLQTIFDVLAYGNLIWHLIWHYI